MKLIIIGCGNMGSGLARRLAPHHHVYLFDHKFEKAKKLQEEGCGTACRELQEGMSEADIAILAVKPQSLQEAVKLISTCKIIPPTLISILTGVTIAQLKTHFPNQRVIRMMPNMAVLYGEGALGLASADPFTIEEKNVLSNLCDPLGKVYWIKEEQINAFTSLAGSGPAFMLVMIEAMIDAGIRMGFSSHDAQDIVHQMIKGSLELWNKSEMHPAEIKWQIASPAGTTIAGIQKLEEVGIRSNIIQTFVAAYDRANQMSE